MNILLIFCQNSNVAFDKDSLSFSNDQHCLLVMIKTFRKIRDEIFRVFRDKVFRVHPTPITYSKINCLWFWHEINSFYFRVPQKPKADNKNWIHLQRVFEYIIWCYPRFFLEPLLFWIFITNIFNLNFDVEFASYADDTLPYICVQHFSIIINFLEPNVNTLFKRFRQNGLIVNSGTNYFLTNPY